MSAPYYQNQNSFSVAVPTASGVDVTVFEGEVVQGEAYAILAYHDILTLVAGPYTYPQLRYSWPGSGGGSGGSGTITGITCVSPISGGGTTGNVSVSLEAEGVTGYYIADGTITADKLASGNVLTGITVGSTTLHDAVTLVAGTNIVLTPTVLTNTIEIATDPNVVSSVTGTLPIIVTTTNGVAALSLAVTPTNNGGAVALQVLGSAPTNQDGIAAVTNVITDGALSANVSYAKILDPNTPLSGLYIKPYGVGENVFSAFDIEDVLTTYLTDPGVLHTTDIRNSAVVESATYILRSDPWDGVNNKLVRISADGETPSFINVGINLYSAINLQQVAVSSPRGEQEGNGKFSGTSTYVPLIDFNTTPTSEAIKLTGEVSSADLALSVYDGPENRTIGLYTDGTIRAKRVISEQLVYTNIVLPAGQYVVANYPTVSTFIINSTTGVSSLTLPLLTASSVNGQVFTFKKLDVTSFAVTISTSQSQTIDSTLTQWSLRKKGDCVSFMSVISGTDYFWVMLDYSEIPATV